MESANTRAPVPAGNNSQPSAALLAVADIFIAEGVTPQHVLSYGGDGQWFTTLASAIETRTAAAGTR